MTAHSGSLRSPAARKAQSSASGGELLARKSEAPDGGEDRELKGRLDSEPKLPALSLGLAL